LPPTVTRNVHFIESGAPVAFSLDFNQDTAPNFGTLAAVKLRPDSSGRVHNAERVEYDDQGNAASIDHIEINDLGEVYRERTFDGSITRYTRNALGFRLRKYMGTNDDGWPDL